MSKRSDALVGAAGMKAKNRGLSQEITAGARAFSNSSSTSAASLPRGLMSPWSALSRADFSPE